MICFFCCVSVQWIVQMSLYVPVFVCTRWCCRRTMFKYSYNFCFIKIDFLFSVSPTLIQENKFEYFKFQQKLVRRNNHIVGKGCRMNLIISINIENYICRLHMWSCECVHTHMYRSLAMLHKPSRLCIDI